MSTSLTPTGFAAEPVLDSVRLAARWHVSAGQIRRLNSVAPDRLPPRLAICSGRLLWRLVDVEAWEASRVVVAVQAAA